MRGLKKIHKSYIIGLWLLIIVAIALGAGFRSWSKNNKLGAKQSKERNIVIKSWMNEPFEILDLNVKGKIVKSDEKFEETEDWIHGLQFKIKNKSEEAITFIHLVLTFPETQSNRPMRAVDVVLGYRAEAQSSKPKNNPLNLIKDDSTSISFAEKLYPRIQNGIQRSGFNITDITRMEITAQEVRFADGRRWALGLWYVQDPTAKTGWRRID